MVMMIDKVLLVLIRLFNFSVLLLCILISVRVKVFFKSLNIIEMVVEVGIFIELNILSRMMFVSIMVSRMYMILVK